MINWNVCCLLFACILWSGCEEKKTDAVPSKSFPKEILGVWNPGTIDEVRFPDDSSFCENVEGCHRLKFQSDSLFISDDKYPQPSFLGVILHAVPDTLILKYASGDLDTLLRTASVVQVEESSDLTVEPATFDTALILTQILQLQKAIASKDKATMKIFTEQDLMLNANDHTWYYLLGAGDSGVHADKTSDYETFDSNDFTQYADTLFFRSDVVSMISKLSIDKSLFQDGKSISFKAPPSMELSITYYDGIPNDPLHTLPVLSLSLTPVRSAYKSLTWEFTIRESSLVFTGLRVD